MDPVSICHFMKIGKCNVDVSTVCRVYLVGLLLLEQEYFL